MCSLASARPLAYLVPKIGLWAEPQKVVVTHMHMEKPPPCFNDFFLHPTASWAERLPRGYVPISVPKTSLDILESPLSPKLGNMKRGELEKAKLTSL